MKKELSAVLKLMEGTVKRECASKNLSDEALKAKLDSGASFINERFKSHVETANSLDYVKAKDGFALFMTMKDLRNYDPTK